MPYTPDHRARSKAQIVESARQIFNQHGFESASIDMIMAHAGLSRGGFYHHFKNKEDLFAQAVASFLHQTFADPAQPDTSPGPALITAALEGYLSQNHLDDIANQCPMIALPSDVARAGPQARHAYRLVFEAMLNFFETNLGASGPEARRQALTLCTLCIGGMVLARTLGDPDLSEELISAARAAPADLGIKV
ncbi:MAG: TetR/AcrR family transcriptional regulator [Marinosulfonomonas sp.]